MKTEYPKHPDFVKRLSSMIRDNSRFRVLLENYLILDDKNKSSVILLQFLMFYDEMQVLRHEIFE
jgi:hypothetical protein